MWVGSLVLNNVQLMCPFFMPLCRPTYDTAPRSHDIIATKNIINKIIPNCEDYFKLS